MMKQLPSNSKNTDALALFYVEQAAEAGNQLVLDEVNSKHLILVLRKKKGDAIRLTDGKGNAMLAEIEEENKKKCVVKIQQNFFTPEPEFRLSMAVSLIKNSGRFEWFLEKATELGVSEIIPLLCKRTEKLHYRKERIQQVCISAMLQSGQFWLPRLREPLEFSKLLNHTNYSRKLIAHCLDGEKTTACIRDKTSIKSALMLIGPEGDFTPEEITLALKAGFEPVTLGNTRLRTETAALVASTLLLLG